MAASGQQMCVVVYTFVSVRMCVCARARTCVWHAACLALRTSEAALTWRHPLHLTIPVAARAWQLLIMLIADHAHCCGRTCLALADHAHC